jgi:hypothetical protein
VEFYEWNTGRDYPLVRGESFAPQSAIVACGFVVGPGSGFVDGQHRIALVKIRRDDNRLEFHFQSDAPGLAGEAIIFERSVADPQYVVEYADADPSQSLSDSLDCSRVDAFTGYCVTGPLDDLLQILEDDGDEITGGATVEPALIQNLSQAFVRSINVANGDRTRFETPEGCPEVEWPVEQQPLYVRGTCAQGPLRFREGYNNTIRQSSFDNSLTFDATVGGGLGEPCEQIPLFEGEEPPEGSSLLDGGPSCADVFRTINGAGGRVVPVSGGLGVSVTFRPGESAITVDVNGHDMTVCSPTLQTPAESLSCDSLSESIEGDAGN